MLHTLFHALAWNWGGDGWGGGNSPGYLIQSGPLANLTIFVAGLSWLLHRNCGEPGCPRIGRAAYGHRCKRHRKATEPSYVKVVLELNGQTIAEALGRTDGQ